MIDSMELSVFQEIPPWEWPQNAGALFLEVLTDTKANDAERLLAAELAGDSTVISNELADALLSVLHDAEQPDDLRAQAAISFGGVLETMDMDLYDDLDDEPITKAMFRRIQASLRQMYEQADTPKEVRRSALESSVRASEDWHGEAIRAAYDSGDKLWRLTAVFCMQYVKGFDAQILESLDADEPLVHYHAVTAAGNWEVDGAWEHVIDLLKGPVTDKDLTLAAIEAAGSIRPEEAEGVLSGFVDHKDEDIAAAAHEAIGMAKGFLELDDDDDDFVFGSDPTIH